MTDVAIIVPSRGRPDRLSEMIVAATRLAADKLEFWFGLDADDPELERYHEVIDQATNSYASSYTQILPRRGLVKWTNHLAERALDSFLPPRYLVSLGDDHCVRTPAWDQIMIERLGELEGPGFAYGNDLFKGVDLPTAWMVHADAVRALGWMMLPTLEHMYPDNVTMDLGRATGRIVYLPNVIIEHRHFGAGKAELDASYRESNAPERFRRDRMAYEQWRSGQMTRDAATLGALKF